MEQLTSLLKQQATHPLVRRLPTGFVPDISGMNGFKATLRDLPNLFALKNDGGKLNRTSIVDFVDGVAPGVFSIIAAINQDVNAN